MIAKYEGYTISVTRERCLGGWSMLYYSIFRDSDGYECESSFEDSAETVRGKITQLKQRIINEHKEDDPWGEKENMKVFSACGDPGREGLLNAANLQI